MVGLYVRSGHLHLQLPQENVRVLGSDVSSSIHDIQCLLALSPSPILRKPGKPLIPRLSRRPPRLPGPQRIHILP